MSLSKNLQAQTLVAVKSLVTKLITTLAQRVLIGKSLKDSALTTTTFTSFGQG